MKKKQKPTVAVYVEGGVVQGARSNTKGIDVEVFDVDNLKETLNKEDIEALWSLREKKYPIAVL